MDPVVPAVEGGVFVVEGLAEGLAAIVQLLGDTAADGTVKGLLMENNTLITENNSLITESCESLSTQISDLTAALNDVYDVLGLIYLLIVLIVAWKLAASVVGLINKA